MSADVLALLRATPARLEELSADVPDELLHAVPEGEWSARDVLAHLRACADVWGEAVARILAEDEPTIRAVNPQAWIAQTDHLAQPFRPSLQAFSQQRDALLALLEPLSPAQWERAATVTGAGRPLRKTVLSYAERMAVHERGHVKQVARLLA